MATTNVPNRASDAGEEFSTQQPAPDFLDLCFEAEEIIRDARTCESRRTGCYSFNQKPRAEKRKLHIEDAIEVLRRALEVC